MPWDSSPSDPAQLQLMKEAGLNISGFCAPKDLPAVLAAGLACFVSDPRVNGYDWTKMPPEAELRGNITAAVRDVENNPAVLGFFLRDEPGADLFPGLGQAAKILVELLPEKWPYVNLFPTYASNAQLGTPDYATYLRRFVEAVHPPFISWDNYSVVEGEMRDRFYTNLELVRRQSLESHIPFWNIVLANTLFNYMEPSDATFSLQAYSTLAYGGRSGCGSCSGIARQRPSPWLGRRKPTPVHGLPLTMIAVATVAALVRAWLVEERHAEEPARGRRLPARLGVTGIAWFFGKC